MTKTTIKPQSIADNVESTGMARQAIMNANFPIVQRITPLTPGTADSFVADRWLIQQVPDGGTLPTVVHSQQVLTPGDIPGSFYHYRIAPNGAGTSLGAGSYSLLTQKIEHGTRYLCGLNKKVTVSFKARSSITNKKLGVYLGQEYGTGGSPSSLEIINGTKWTLTSTWTQYSYTFTTNTLAGKTFGTANNDNLRLVFASMWGSTYQGRVGDTVAETFVGSGNIDITDVELNADDVALPFMSKTEGEEKLACWKYAFAITTANAYEIIGQGFGSSTTEARIVVNLPVKMRIIPTLTATPGDYILANLTDALDLTGLVLDASHGQGLNTIILKATTTGVTQYRPYLFIGDASPGRILLLSAEL